MDEKYKYRNQLLFIVIYLIVIIHGGVLTFPTEMSELQNPYSNWRYINSIFHPLVFFLVVSLHKKFNMIGHIFIALASSLFVLFIVLTLLFNS